MSTGLIKEHNFSYLKSSWRLVYRINFSIIFAQKPEKIHPLHEILIPSNFGLLKHFVTLSTKFNFILNKYFWIQEPVP